MHQYLLKKATFNTLRLIHFLLSQFLPKKHNKSMFYKTFKTIGWLDNSNLCFEQSGMKSFENFNLKYKIFNQSTFYKSCSFNLCFDAWPLKSARAEVQDLQ